MAREVRTPIADGDVVELGNGIYRKQVLRPLEIDYRGRKIRFDRGYFDNVASSFRAQAFDTVPFVLAPENNSHTMAAERGAYGEVLGMESSDDGLFATLRLSEEAERIVQANPKFGVSVRVKEQYTRPDGQHYPAAMQHLLGTWDPKITGLSPWEPVDLSNEPGTEVIDLSKPDDTEEQDMTASLAGPDLADLIARGVISVNDPDALDAAGVDWTADGDTAAADDTAEDTDGAEDGNRAWPLDGDGFPDIEAMSPEEFAAWSQTLADDESVDDTDDDLGDIADADESDEGDHTDEPYADTDDPDDYGHTGADPAEVAASHAYGAALELSHDDPDEYHAGYQAAVVEMSGEQNELRGRLDAGDYREERNRIVQRYGIPPYLIDLAQPLLQGSGRDVVLSNGETGDAGEVMRGFIDGLGKAMDRLGINLLDLSQSHGQVLTGSGELDAADAAERTAKARAVAAAIY
ncbi:hypothetical protein [Microcystis phage Mwe-JY05]